MTTFYLPQPGQQCTTSCTNTSQSVQKSLWHSGQRYRPKGLIPSPTAPAMVDGISLKAIAHPWHRLLRLGVSSSVILPE